MAPALKNHWYANGEAPVTPTWKLAAEPTRAVWLSGGNVMIGAGRTVRVALSLTLTYPTNWSLFYNIIE